MGKKKIRIVVEDNCAYLVQDLYGLDLYERSKAISRFVKTETKVLEEVISMLIKGIFQRNGIEILSTEKSALKSALDTLKGKGKDIRVCDLYADARIEHCEKVCLSSNYFTIMLEEDRYLQCGVRVEERKLI